MNSTQHQKCELLYLLFVDDDFALTAPENNKKIMEIHSSSLHLTLHVMKMKYMFT